MTAPAPDSTPRPRVLLAEDDPRLAGAFARRLEAEYLAIDVVTTVAAARDHERGCAYACLVLDRLLPDGDVLGLVRELDDRPAHPPIVLVSAVADEEDRLVGLRAGADDYVGKPVHLDELAVRVTRLLDRVPEPAVDPFDPIVIGPITLDPVRLRVHAGGTPLALAPPQVLVLRVLLLRAGRAVRVEDLVTATEMSETGITTATLPGHIDILRDALAGHVNVESAPRRAYVLHVEPRPPGRSRWRLGRRRPS